MGILRFWRSTRASQSGNVFFALFGAVALVGVVGATSMQIMKGPVRSMSEVTKRTVAENNMIASSKLALLAATTQTNDGDCDSDNYVEPIPFEDAGVSPKPTGGGYLPATIGAAINDPWDTRYGYCVWNNGATTTGAGCGANLLAGANDGTAYTIAIISAGPDRIFNTTCSAYPSATPLNKAAGSDDVVLGYTYAEASANSGGLWNLQSGNPDTAEINKNLAVKSSGGSTTFALDAETGIGDFIGLTTGAIAAKGTNPLAITGGLKLDTTPVETGACTAANTDAFAFDTASDRLIRCNGSNWVLAGGADNLGNHTATENIHLASYWLSGDGGNEGIQVSSSGDVSTSGPLSVAGTLSSTGATTLSSTLGVTGATTLTTLTTSGLGTLNSLSVTNNAGVGGTLSVTGGTTLTALTAGASTLDSLAVTNAATIGTTLGVTGATTLTTLATSGLSTLDSLAVTNNASVGGQLDMTSGKIVNLLDPTLAQDAASKAYVDARVAAGTGFVEADPQVGTLQASKWCVANAGGTALDCDQSAPIGSTTLAALTDVNTTGVANGNCLVYNSGTSKWEDGACSGADNLGNHTATQAIDMATFKITNMADPTAAQDAATKAYVDSLLGSGNSNIILSVGSLTGTTAASLSQGITIAQDGILVMTGKARATCNPAVQSTQIVTSTTSVGGVTCSQNFDTMYVNNSTTEVSTTCVKELTAGTYTIANASGYTGTCTRSTIGLDWMVVAKNASGGGGGGGGSTKGFNVAGSTTSLSSGIQAAVVFSSAPVNNDFTGAWSSNKTFTVPTGDDGWYVISGYIRADSLNGGLTAYIHKNGANLVVSRDINSSTANSYVTGTAIAYLVAGDVIELKAKQNSGGTISLADARLSLVKVDGGSGGGGGATTLAALTDVDTTGVANGNCLVYNSGTSKWEDGACGSGGGSSAMVPGWPDAITCGNYSLYLRKALNTDGYYEYADPYDGAGSRYYARFNISDGTYNTGIGSGTACAGESIASLEAAGRTFNFGGSGGSGADNLGNHIATQDIDMATFKITNMADPTAAQDAATKAYVDALASGMASSGFVIVKGTGQSVPTGSSPTSLLDFDTTSFDTIGGVNLSTNEFTAPRAGWYDFAASVQWQSLGSTVMSGLRIRLTSGPIVCDDFGINGSTDSMNGCSGHYYLSAGQVVQVVVWHYAGSNQTVDYARFSGVALSSGSGGGGMGDDLGNHTATQALAMGGYAINNSGNINVGASGTTYELQLHDPGANRVDAQFTNSTTGATATDGFVVSMTDNDVALSNRENGYIGFNTNATEKMRLKSDGNLELYYNLFLRDANGANSKTAGLLSWDDALYFRRYDTAGVYEANVANLDLNTGTFTATAFSGSGASLTNLNASNLASGTVATARLGSGTANSTTYLRGDGTWATVTASGDNLGNHTATTTLNLGTQWLSGSAAANGLRVGTNGNVQIDYSGANYDVWIQGGASGAAGSARNLALLGYEPTDTLYLNYGGEYAGGTIVSGPSTYNGDKTINAETYVTGAHQMYFGSLGTYIDRNTIDLVTTGSAYVALQGAADSRSIVEFGTSNASAEFWTLGTYNRTHGSTSYRKSLRLTYYNGSAYVNGFVMTPTGEMGIGLGDPASVDYMLEVNGTAGKPGGGSWTNSSDIRLKNVDGSYERGLEEIVKLDPIRFHYKKDNPRKLPSDAEEIGFSAQAVREAIPEAVSTGKDGYLDFNIHPINVAMVNAVKELDSRDKAVEKRIADLESRTPGGTHDKIIWLLLGVIVLQALWTSYLLVRRRKD